MANPFLDNSTNNPSGGGNPFLADGENPFADGGKDEGYQGGTGKAFARSAARSAAPTAGALAVGAKVGAMTAPLGPWVAVPAGILAAAGTAIGIGYAQDKIVDAAVGDDSGFLGGTFDTEQIRRDREAHPYATFAGEVAPGLVTMNPAAGLRNLAVATGRREAAPLVKQAVIRNIAIGTGAEVGVEGIQQAVTGEFDPMRLGMSAVFGATMNEPNAIGRRLGVQPTQPEIPSYSPDDAEYNRRINQQIEENADASLAAEAQASAVFGAANPKDRIERLKLETKYPHPVEMDPRQGLVNAVVRDELQGKISLADPMAAAHPIRQPAPRPGQFGEGVVAVPEAYGIGTTDYTPIPPSSRAITEYPQIGLREPTYDLAESRQIDETPLIQGNFRSGVDTAPEPAKYRRPINERPIELADPATGPTLPPAEPVQTPPDYTPNVAERPTVDPRPAVDMERVRARAQANIQRDIAEANAAGRDLYDADLADEIAAERAMRGEAEPVRPVEPEQVAPRQQTEDEVRARLLDENRALTREQLEAMPPKEVLDRARFLGVAKNAATKDKAGLIDAILGSNKQPVQAAEVAPVDPPAQAVGSNKPARARKPATPVSDAGKAVESGKPATANDATAKPPKVRIVKKYGVNGGNRFARVEVGDKTFDIRIRTGRNGSEISTSEIKRLAIERLSSESVPTVAKSDYPELAPKPAPDSSTASTKVESSKQPVRRITDKLPDGEVSGPVEFSAYHGSSKALSSLSDAKVGTGDPGFIGPGHYFYLSKDNAKSAGVVHTATVRMSNPLDVNAMRSAPIPKKMPPELGTFGFKPGDLISALRIGDYWYFQVDGRSLGSLKSQRALHFLGIDPSGPRNQLVTFPEVDATNSMTEVRQFFDEKFDEWLSYYMRDNTGDQPPSWFARAAAYGDTMRHFGFDGAVVRKGTSADFEADEIMVLSASQVFDLTPADGGPARSTTAPPAQSDVAPPKPAPDKAEVKAPKSRGNTSVTPGMFINPADAERAIRAAIAGGKWAASHTADAARWLASRGSNAIRSIVDATKALVAQFGEAIRKHAPRIWKAAQEFIRDETGAVTPERLPPGVKQAALAAEKVGERIGKAVKGGASNPVKATIDASAAMDKAKSASKSVAEKFQYYAEPVYEFVRRKGGVAAGEVADRARHAIDQSKAIFGQLAVDGDLDKALEAARANNAATKWLGSTDANGVTNFRLALEGNVEVPAFAKQTFDALAKFNRAVGDLTVKEGMLKEATGAAQRMPTWFQLDIIKQGSGPKFDALVNAYAKVNKGVPKDRIRELFSEIKAAIDDGDFSAVTKKINQEHRRVFKQVPSMLELPGVFGPRKRWLFHDRPFEYARVTAERTAHRVGFRRAFGDDEAAAAMVKAAKGEMASGDGVAVGDLVRALHGMPPDLGRFGSTSSGLYAINRLLSDVFSPVALSTSAPVNAIELAIGQTPRSFGYRDYLEATGRVFGKDGAGVRAAIEEMGAINKAVYDWSFDAESKGFQALRTFRNAATMASGNRYLNELQELLAAVTAQVRTERMKAGRLTAKEAKATTGTLIDMGFDAATAKKMVDGKSNQADYDAFVRRAAAYLTGGNKALAESSRFQANRLLSNLFRFQTYPVVQAQAIMRPLQRALAGDKSAWRSVAMQLGATTATGASISFVKAMMTGGTDGMEILANEAGDEPIAFMANSLLNGIGGPLSMVWWASMRSGEDGDYAENIARMTFPGGVALEVKDFLGGYGAYKDRTLGERAMTYLERTPVGRVGSSWLGSVAYGEIEAGDKAAIQAYWRWRRDAGMSNVSASGGEAEHVAFRSSMRRAANAIKAGDDPSKHIREALGVRPGDKKAAQRMAQSLTGKRLLAGLTPDQQDKLRNRIGEAAYNRLVRHDYLLTQWAKRLN